MTMVTLVDSAIATMPVQRSANVANPKTGFMVFFWLFIRRSVKMGAVTPSIHHTKRNIDIKIWT